MPHPSDEGIIDLGARLDIHNQVLCCYRGGAEVDGDGQPLQLARLLQLCHVAVNGFGVWAAPSHLRGISVLQIAAAMVASCRCECMTIGLDIWLRRTLLLCPCGLVSCISQP